jgi:Phytanoyl-CoA dioxygenase (PhyH)
MKPVLRDQDLDLKLLKEGYVVIPFLSASEVQELKEVYYRDHPRNLSGMAATAHLPDLDMRMKMNDAIKKVFERPIRENLANINALGGSFIAKGKGQQGTLSPHQDWNIVDENLFRSFNIWVPLVDLTPTNGAICVMPGSHSWLRSYRSANIASAYHQVDDLLWQRMASLYMRAGEALVYDHRLIHASGENQTDEIRLAAVFGIIPEGASMVYYHKKDDATVEVYESSKEFFLYENIFDGPKTLKKINEVPYTFPLIDARQLDQLSGYRPGVLQRLRAIFHL